MDQIILNRNAEKWIEACQFLKSAEIKPQLDASEWTAVEGLSELWSKPYERGRVKENAEDLISILKTCIPTTWTSKLTANSSQEWHAICS